MISLMVKISTEEKENVRAVVVDGVRWGDNGTANFGSRQTVRANNGTSTIRVERGPGIAGEGQINYPGVIPIFQAGGAPLCNVDATPIVDNTAKITVDPYS